MNPVKPDTGAPEVELAKRQPQYLPIIAAVYIDSELGDAQVMVTRWRPDRDERIALCMQEMRDIVEAFAIHLGHAFQMYTGGEILKQDVRAQVDVFCEKAGLTKNGKPIDSLDIFHGQVTFGAPPMPISLRVGIGQWEVTAESSAGPQNPGQGVTGQTIQANGQGIGDAGIFQRGTGNES